MHVKRTRPLAAAVIALLSVLILHPPDAGAQGMPPPPPPPGGGSSGAAGYLHPLDPARILDTRSGVGATGKVRPGSEIALQVRGKGGVPNGAGAVVLNVTATAPTAAGYLTVYPSGTTRPTASNINFVAGQTVPNLVVAKIGSDGKVRIFNSAGTTHVVADVMGWYDDIFASFPNLPTGGAKQRAITPARLVDTRTSSGVVGSGREIELKVTGTGGVPSGATAGALNVTAVNPSAGGYVTVYPSGGSRPTTSNLNFNRGQTVPNMVVAKVGAGGKVKLFTSAATHLVVDVTAFYQPVQQILGGGEMNAVTPARILDTRKGTGASAAKVGPGQSVSLNVLGVGGVLNLNVDSVVLNVTVTAPTSSGYLTVHPSNGSRPTTSNLNFSRGQTVPSLVIAKVGTDGRIKLFNSSGTTHVIADVVGWTNSDVQTGGNPFSAAPPPAAEGAGGAGVRVGTATEEIPDFAELQRDFWAENDPTEKLAESTPEPLLDRGGLPSGVPNSEAPAVENTKFQIWSQGYSYYSNPRYDNRIGRLLYYIPSESRWSNCTATMVARNLAVTAAHCVVNAGGNYTNFAFFAGLEGNTVNGGIYTNVIDTVRPSMTNGQAAWLHPSYKWAADYAFIRFGPTNGKYPGDVVGSYSMMINPPLNWLKSYGYPSEGSYFSRFCARAGYSNGVYSAGCYMYETWGRYGGYERYTGGWYEIGWGTDMSGGASGGPVFANDNGVMRIASVNSNGHTEVCDTDAAGRCVARRHLLNMWGPYFTDHMLKMHAAYRV